MRKPMLAVGAIAIGLAVPAAVLGGVDDGFWADDFAGPGQSSAWWTSQPVKTNRKQYKDVPRMPQGDAVTLDINGPSPVYVSVDLKAGKAKIRMIDGGGEVVRPTAVTFAGKGVSTATFIVPGDGFENPTIQWRKVGDQKVKAASVTASLFGEID